MTEAVCRKHLDAEYADLRRTVVGKLARKSPPPLVRGDFGIWAAGGVYVVAQQNFLFGPSQTPHAAADQLSERTGAGKTTMSNKARLIRDTLRLSHDDTDLIGRELVESKSLAWLVEVDGMVAEVRQAPAWLHVMDFEQGLILHLPGPVDDRP